MLKVGVPRKMKFFASSILCGGQIARLHLQ
jgi:hypothetical protein